MRSVLGPRAKSEKFLTELSEFGRGVVGDRNGLEMADDGSVVAECAGGDAGVSRLHLVLDVSLELTVEVHQTVGVIVDAIEGGPEDGWEGSLVGMQSVCKFVFVCDGVVFGARARWEIAQVCPVFDGLVECLLDCAVQEPLGPVDDASRWYDECAAVG